MNRTAEDFDRWMETHSDTASPLSWPRVGMLLGIAILSVLIGLAVLGFILDASRLTLQFDPAEFVWAFMLLIGLGLYFLPTWVATQRQHHNAMAIALLNTFLGWTLLGWVGALVWAATAVQRQEEGNHAA